MLQFVNLYSGNLINMEKQTSLTKYIIDQKAYYVKIYWKPNENDLFHITIFDNNNTWSGRYSNEIAKKFMERLDENEEEYNSNLKKAMSNEQDFVCVLQVSKDSGTFSWKKKFEDSQHGVGYLVFCSVPIHPDLISESKDVLVDFLLEENQELKNIIDSLTARNEELIVDLNNCKENLVKFVDIKTNLETSLYGKFVQLLNAKKRRIQILEDSINKIENPNRNIGDELD